MTNTHAVDNDSFWGNKTASELKNVTRKESSHIERLFFTRTVDLFGIHPVCLGVLKRMDILQMGSLYNEFIHAEDLGD